MATRLYLDTARLGLMRPGARRLYQDFVRFAGEEGCSLYWEDFLRQGVSQWPEDLRCRYPALRAWKGLSHFKESVKRLAGAAPESEVLLANRSAQIMKLAARLLVSCCRNVLLTDLTWPGYLKILRRVQKRSSCRLTRVALRKRLLRKGMTHDELIELVIDRFVQFGCDGLFLPAVDHLGVRIPVGRIVRAIERRAEVRFVVVDGAQALAHVPLRLADNHCDFFIAGCHKWLGTHHPLGLGLFGHPRSVDYIRRAAFRFVRKCSIDDPLLRFTDQLENDRNSRFGETVNVTPLLSAQGAVDDCDPGCLATTLRSRLANADRLLSRIRGSNWRHLIPDAALRCGILMLEAQDARRDESAVRLRMALHQHGIAASTYDGGRVRLSMPAAEWSVEELEHLARFFRGP